MDNSTEVSIITITCISSFILFCCCYKCFRDKSKEKNKNNLIFKKRVKPISEMTNKELKDEFEKFGIRPPEIIGEENI